MAKEAGQSVSERGVSCCRSCRSSNLFSALDLGRLPIANELPTEESPTTELYPLHLRICPDCGLGQIGEPVSPYRLFDDYRYRSSMSSTFDSHIEKFVRKLIDSNAVKQNELIVEIASNDGYLLRYFQDFDQNILGIEPSKNISAISKSLGIPTICDYFSTDLAKHIIKTRGYPRFVIANNVMAHVPNLLDFVEGLSTLANDKTTIFIENPSLINLLESSQFDSIYHEHFSYLSTYSVSRLVEQFDLKLVDVDSLSIHGGSNRYTLRHKSANVPMSSNVLTKISQEINSGFLAEEKWHSLSARVDSIIRDFRKIFSSSDYKERRIVGYGAAAKASTVINMASVSKKEIVAIVDTNPEKIGRYMPSANIPIVSEKMGIEIAPTDIIVFPWNIQEELVDKIRDVFGSQVRVWSINPSVRIV